MSTKNQIQTLKDLDGNVTSLRPWLGTSGKSVVTRGNGGIYPSTIVALHTKQQMEELDKATLKISKIYLSVVGELLDTGLLLDNTYNGKKPKNTLTTVHQEKVDIANVEGMPTYTLESLPLPLVYSPTWQVPMTQATPNISLAGESLVVDVGQAEAGAYRVAEKIERIAVGMDESFYGFCNHPRRFTRVIDDSATLLQHINMAIAMLEDNKFFGPVMIFNGSSFDVELDSDWIDSLNTSYPQKTVREAILDISRPRPKMTSTFDEDGCYLGEVEDKGPPLKIVRCCKRMNYADDSIVVVSANASVARMVVSLYPTVVRWEDGYQTWAVMMPNLRLNSEGNLGVVHLKRG